MFWIKTATLSQPPGSAENKAFRLLKEEWGNYVRWGDICFAVRHIPELQAVLRRPDLPDQQAVERLLRYETTIERQFYKAMDALDRLQRRRWTNLFRHP